MNLDEKVAKRKTSMELCDELNTRKDAGMRKDFTNDD
jgi:hypothetical protein